MKLRLISNQERSRFSNRTVKHSNRTVIACKREPLSVYPQEANCSWHGDVNASYILYIHTEQLLSFQYQLLPATQKINQKLRIIFYMHTKLQYISL